MIVTHKLQTMDLAHKQNTSRVDVVQDDKYSHNLEFAFTENGVQWKIPDGATAVVRYKKPDGTGGNYDTLPDGSTAYRIEWNLLTVSLAPQVCTVQGLVQLSVGLIQGSAEINTFPVNIVVQPNPGATYQSEDYVKLSGAVPNSGWSPNMYLGTDAQGNVVAKEDKTELVNAVIAALTASGYVLASKIQLTFGADFEGKTYTITGGENETYTGTVPATLIVTQTIKTINTEYVVTCTNADDVTYERAVTIGSYYGVYQSEFVSFRAYLFCTADAGCTVIATNGSKTYSGVADSNGEVTLNIGATGTYSVTASKGGSTTGAVTVEVTEAGSTYTCKLPSLSGPEIVSWADGTDEQIAAMVAALEDGTLTVEGTGWAVGDKRTVQLGAMAATGVGESHAAQTVQLVLSHAGATKGITRADGKPIHFQVDQVESLNESGYMNSSNTNSGSWNGCARRTWCNAIYYNAIPEALRPIFKQMKVTAAETYNGSTLKESEDFFALRAEKEIFGAVTYSNATEAAALEQIDWYKTAANRKKLINGSADNWWERSPAASGSSYFCSVYSNGSASYNGAKSAFGLAPFGCI